MKKFLAVLLAVLMAAAMGTVAMAGGPAAYEIAAKGQAPFAAGTRPSIPEVKVGETLELALYKLNYDTMIYEPYDGTVAWTTKGYKPDWLSVSNAGVVTGLPSKETRESEKITVYASPEDDTEWQGFDYWYRDIMVRGKFSLKLDPAELTMKRGDKALLSELLHCYIVRDDVSLDIDNVGWDSKNYNIVGILSEDDGEYLYAVKNGTTTITASTFLADSSEAVTLSCMVTVTADGKPSEPEKPTDPDEPDDKPTNPDDKPTTPDKPSKPDKPGTTPAETESPEQAEYTANKAAEAAAVDLVREANAALAAGKELPAKAQSVTTAAGTAITAVPVKLSGLEASLSLDTMDLLAGGKVGLKASINSGAAEVILPAGFTHTPEPGRFGYPLGFQKDPRGSDLMTELVKGDTAKTETCKLGGNVVLPTTATVTIKTKLDGKVNVYYWNDETRKTTLIASPTAADGRVTFATKQLGHLILTTGTI